MARNPILDELYATREKLLAEYKGDVHAYVQDARRRAMASGRPIAVPKERAKRIPKTAEPGISKTADYLTPAG
jgi:hypothetical protein